MPQDSKKNDLLLNVLANPEYTMTDFIDVGVNAGNSTIKSRNEYINNEKIRMDPMFAGSDGMFSEEKFNKFYDAVNSMYNVMANKSYDEMLIDEIETDPYNILADPLTKRYSLEDQVKMVEFGKDIPLLNPNRTKFSVGGIGKMSEGAWTPQELAQMSQRYNPETGKFEESPEEWFTGEHWYSNLGKTTVMATYSEDDPEVKSGERQAGEYKLNDQGTYYTEFLNGRSTYNREIVSKLDLLTKEGSWINRYDFFDSDDKDKNVFGSIMRNVATIAPMFIPYVGQYYILGSIAMQTGGIASTVGKMALGVDNDIVNDIDGFFSQFQGGTSQYSKEHTFSAENLINMFGQVVSQIKEQRWIFKDAPKFFKGKDIMNDAKEIKKMNEAFSKASFERYAERVKNGDKSIKQMFLDLAGGDASKLDDAMKAMANTEARLAVEAAQKNAMKYSELISQIYMTGVTTADTYNQIKAEGGSDMQALALTLGYSMAEFGLLKTDIGKWIMPETRIDAQKLKQTLDVLGKAEDAAISAGTRAARNGFIQKGIAMGKELYESIPYGGTKAVIGGAMSEGIEETSEELLADIVKVAGNTYNWLTGDDLRYQTFDNMAERYGMSFIGGMAGGGFTTATGLFKDINSGALESIKTKDQAMEYLAYTLRNNGLNKVLKAIDKAQWGNQNLSTEEVDIAEDSEYGLEFTPGTSMDNQDKVMKDVMKKIVTMYNDLLSNNGLNIHDDESVRKALLSNVMYSLISKSVTASSYVSDFNSAVKDFVKAKMDYDAVKMRIYDTNRNGNIEDKEKRNNEPNNNDLEALRAAEENLRMKKENAQAYINGKNTSELILKSIFELNPELSGAFKNSTLESYIISKYGVDPDTLTKEKLLQYTNEYNDFIKLNGKDYLNESFMIFKNMMGKLNPYITKENMEFYQKMNMDKEALEEIESGFTNAETMLALVNAGIPDFELFGHLSNLAANDVNKESGTSVSGIDERAILSAVLETYKDNNGIKSIEDYVMNKEQAPDGTKSNDEISDEFRKNNPELFRGMVRAAIDGIVLKYAQSVSRLAKSLEGSKYIDPTVKRSIVDIYNRLYKSFINVDKKDFMSIAKMFGGENITFEDAINNKDIKELLDLKKQYDPAQAVEVLFFQKGYEEPDYETRNILENLNINYDLAGNIAPLDESIAKIASLPESPALEMIEKMGFEQANGIKAIDLYNGIMDIFQSKSGDMKSFTLTQKQEENVKSFIKYSAFLTSILDATRDDNRSLINPLSFIDTAKKYTSNDPSSIWKNMETIPGEAAKKMKYELDRMSSRLSFYMMVGRLNDGNNTKEVKKLETNMNILKYKSLKEFVDVLSGISTEDKKRLNEVMSDPAFDIAKKIDSNRDSMDLNIPEDQLKALYAAIDKAEQAIYDIVKDNKSLLEKDGIGSYISNTIDNVMENVAIDSASKNFSPMHKIWYIASVVAMNPHLKHSMMSSVYAQKDIMPNALQMHSAEMAVSFIANREVFHKFSVLFKSAVDDNFGDMMNNGEYDKIFSILEGVEVSLSKETIDKINPGEEMNATIKFLYQNSQLYNIFDSIMFIEGVPGSGKTSAVLNRIINRMLTAKDNNGNNYVEDLGELSSNIYYVTTENMIEQSKEATKGIFGSSDGPKMFTHAKFLEDAFGINKADIDKKFNDDSKIGGNDGNDYVVRYTGKHNYGDTRKKPSIILIDEATLYNQQQMSAINDMARELNIPVVAFGDTNQIQNATKFNPSKNDKLVNLPVDKLFNNNSVTGDKNNFSFQVFSGQFMSSPKIGFYMRPNNSHITTTMNAFRVGMEMNIRDKKENPISTHYYYGKEGLYGVKITNTTDGLNISNDGASGDLNIIKSMIDDVREQIETAKNSPDGAYEKIGFVGNRKFLSDMIDTYGDKLEIGKDDIDKYFDVFSTPEMTIGMERKFYIINSNDANWDQSTPNDIKEEAYHNLYTAMSRIKQGALVFHSSGGKVNSIRDNALSLTKIDQNDINKYSDNFAKMYAEALGENVITVDPVRVFEKKNEEEGDKDQDNRDKDKSNNDDPIDEIHDSDNDNVDINNADGTKKRYLPAVIIGNSLFDNIPSKKLNDQINEDKDKDNGNRLKNTIGYTFNMFELGKDFFVDEKNKKIQFSVNSFDSLNGLFKIAMYFSDDLKNMISRKTVEKDAGKKGKVNVDVFEIDLNTKIGNYELGNFLNKEMLIGYVNRMHYALTSDLFDSNGNPIGDPVKPLLNVISDFIKIFGVNKSVEDLRSMLVKNNNKNGSSLYFHKLDVFRPGSVIGYDNYAIISNEGDTGTYNVNYYNGEEAGTVKNKEDIRARLSYIAKFEIGKNSKGESIYIPLEIYISSIENFETYCISLNNAHDLGLPVPSKNAKINDKIAFRNSLRNKIANSNIAEKNEILKKFDTLRLLYERANHTVCNLGTDNNDEYGMGLLTNMIIKGPTLVSDEKVSNEGLDDMVFEPQQIELSKFGMMSGMKISSPMVAVKEGGNDELNKVINDGYLKRGYPFVIVQEGGDTNMSDEDMLKGFISQCLNIDNNGNSTNKKVKRFRAVHINMPSFTIENYLDKITGIINKNDVLEVNGNIIDKSNSKYIGDVLTSINIVTRFLGFSLNDMKNMSKEDFIKNHMELVKNHLGDIATDDLPGKILEDIYNLLYNDSTSIPLSISEIANRAYNGSNNIFNYYLMLLSGYASTEKDGKFNIMKNANEEIRSKFIKKVEEEGFNVVYATARSNGTIVIDGVAYIDRGGSKNNHSMRIGSEDYPMTVFGKIIPSTIYVDVIDVLSRSVEEMRKKKNDNEKNGKKSDYWDNKPFVNRNNMHIPGVSDANVFSNQPQVKTVKKNITQAYENDFGPDGSPILETEIEYVDGNIAEKLRSLSSKYMNDDKALKVPIFYVDDSGNIKVFYVDKGAETNNNLNTFYDGKGEFTFTNGDSKMEFKYINNNKVKIVVYKNEESEGVDTNKNAKEEIIEINKQDTINKIEEITNTIKDNNTLKKVTIILSNISTTLKKDKVDEVDIKGIRDATEKLKNILKIEIVKKAIGESNIKFIDDFIGKFAEENNNESRNCKIVIK